MLRVGGTTFVTGAWELQAQQSREVPHDIMAGTSETLLPTSIFNPVLLMAPREPLDTEASGASTQGLGTSLTVMKTLSQGDEPSHRHH
jgi:hypothetical protein